jgi:hypothetical protein
MIYLNQGTNSVVSTLYEKSQSLNPHYIWCLERKGTFDKVLFYQEDNSRAPWYWNSFTVSVNMGIGLTAGKIEINSGEYIYKVYEASSFPYDLSPTASNVVGLVETGIANVIGTFSTRKTYEGTIDEKRKYYNNG